MKKTICLLLGLMVLTSGCSFSLWGADNTQELPVVGSAANLKRLLGGNQNYFGTMFRSGEVAVDASTANTAETKLGSSPSYSDTNVQVQGVDEADIVKTDGQFLYHIVGRKVMVTRAWPADSLAIARELEFDKSFAPVTLYVDGKYLVVIGNEYEEMDDPGYGIGKPEGRMPMPMRWSSSTRVMVYNKADFNLVRDVALDGWNVTSRKKDNFLYLINSRYVGWFEADKGPDLPWFCGNVDGDEKEKTEIGYKDIQYFPGGHLSDYVLFAALDIDSGKFQVDAYLGSAQHIYMSHENLYVAMTDWVNTTVYRFAVDKTNLEFKAKGEVPGTPLNQFSMDEHKGHFRIATTQWNNDETTNNVVVMDSQMVVTGTIKNIAPGERIFSARFMGDKGYLVTFEMIDPLFVLDLSNPRAPKILGELKIPGFSTYLHPLDDNHLLGIGRDTEVRSMYGREFVVELGIKLAIFDVSDVNNPIEKHVEIIGGQGTWSEVLYNHKALFFHQGILAIPANVTNIEQREDYWNYRLQYQGALFYNVDLEAGFSEIGRISHTPTDLDETEKGVDEGYYRYHSIINRIVQIGDVFYTVSSLNVMAHGTDFTKLAEIDLPVVQVENWWR